MEILIDELVDDGGCGDPHLPVSFQHILQLSNIALNAQNLVTFGCKKKYISLEQTNKMFLTGWVVFRPAILAARLYRVGPAHLTRPGILAWVKLRIEVGDVARHNI